jgi:SAM-dependent methyltransferase
MVRMHSALSLLVCPRTGESLHPENGALVSTHGNRYTFAGGIPALLSETAATREENIRKTVQHFYEEVTFPGYDGVDSPAVLIEKAGKSGFGLWVNRAISPFATVLEVGCGTGQMSNYLGLVSTRTVIGVDMSMASLKLGQQFKERFDLHNVQFVQGNIFSMPVRRESVDVLICSGVLHHTPEPRKGFESLLRLIKPGGKILIGLYNSYARIPLGIRKAFFRITGNACRSLDSHMRRKDVDRRKKEIWFSDQYQNPHESWHSVDEVLRWFDENNVTFLSGVPAIAGGIEGEEEGMHLFSQHPRGSALQHHLRQIGWMCTIGREGGLFVLVGQKDHFAPAT